MANSTNMSHKQNTTKKAEKEAEDKSKPTEVGKSSSHRRYLQEKVKISYRNGSTDKYFFVRCENVKVTHKQDSEDLVASDDVDPYAYALDGRSHEVQLSSIDPDQKRYFEFLLEKQDPKVGNPSTVMPSMVIYKYSGTDGDCLYETKFAKIIIEEISKENNKAFDAKIKALSAKFLRNMNK